MNGRKIIYTSSFLDKNQIMKLVWDSYEADGTMDGDQGDMAGYVEMSFGSRIFDEGFGRFTDREVQDWYYLEYLPDRESDIKNGHDRGQ